MALFNRDYDRNYGSRGTTGPGRGYDRGLRGSGQYAWRETKDETSELFGRDYDRGYRGGAGRTTGYTGATGYDRGYGTRGRDDYGAGYKSRAQTDTGDPFGDRQSGTPIRMVRERDEGGWFGWGSKDYDRDQRYDRGYRGTTSGQDYSSNPVGYDPYSGGRYNTGRKVNEYEGQHRAGARGYDRGVRGSAQYAWRETKDETSELFGRDRDRGDRGYRGGSNRGYDRGWF